MKKNFIFASIIFAVLTAFGIAFARNSNFSAQQIEVRSPLRSVRIQAAIRRNHIIEVKDFKGREYSDLRSLTLASDIVFVGIPQQSNAEVDLPKETTVSTVYSIQPIDVFKGNIERDREFRVKTPGGLIKFENGTTAEMKLPEGWRNPVVGAKYLFFIKKRGSDYLITGGPQGLFQVMDNNALEPQTNYPSVQSIRGKTIDNLVSDIR